MSNEDKSMTSDDFRRKAVAARINREAKCAHRWRVISETVKNTKKEVLIVCDGCGADKTKILNC